MNPDLGQQNPFHGIDSRRETHGMFETRQGD